MTDNILISAKRTVFDHNMEDYTYDELHEQYDAEELQMICESHETHYNTLAGVEHVLEDHAGYDVVASDSLSADVVEEHDAVISLGGDGTVLETAKYVEDDTPLLPIRSDGKSRGGLCTVGMEDAAVAAMRLAEGKYAVEEWSRIEGHHGDSTDIGLGEVFIGAADTTDAADYTIRHNGVRERHKSSGIVVSTGAGSTGWYKNVDEDYEPFERNMDELRYAVREPMDDQENRYTLRHGVIRPGDEFTVKSHMNDNKQGIIRYDGDKQDRTHDFSRAKEIDIRIAATPLTVVTSLYREPPFTVDAIIEHDEHLALIRRGRPPFKDRYALPGGHVDVGEEPEDAAIREVAEEMGVEAEVLEELGQYQDVLDEPRYDEFEHRAYVCRVTDTELRGGDDAAAAEWVSFEEVAEKPFAFGHETIINDYLKEYVDE